MFTWPPQIELNRIITQIKYKQFQVYSRHELESIAEVARRRNLLILADEVYDQLTLDEELEPHVSIASLPDMWRRVVTVGSFGKTFSVTGWKIGWAAGPRELIKPMQLIHQNSVFVAPTNLQLALAQTLGE